MKTLNLATATAVFMIATAAAAFAAGSATVAYPASYRSWTHVKSMLINPGHPLYDSFGGIHHLYANKMAMQGYKTGKFPDGAVIAFDLLAAQSADSAVTEGKRKVLGVMQRDTKRFGATGGWGFEAFAGDSASERVVGAKAASACFACHESQKGTQYVFSRYRN